MPQNLNTAIAVKAGLCFSKSLLEWPALASTQSQSERELEGSPMHAEAWAPADRNTFDALWGARVEQR